MYLVYAIKLVSRVAFSFGWASSIEIHHLLALKTLLGNQSFCDMLRICLPLPSFTFV